MTTTNEQGILSDGRKGKEGGQKTSSFQEKKMTKKNKKLLYVFALTVLALAAATLLSLYDKGQKTDPDQISQTSPVPETSFQTDAQRPQASETVIENESTVDEDDPIIVDNPSIGDYPDGENSMAGDENAEPTDSDADSEEHYYSPGENDTPVIPDSDD